MARVKISLPERLEDGNVALRPLRPQDAAPYAAAFRDDPGLGRLLGVETDPDEAAIRERIDSQARSSEDTRFFQMAIVDPVTDAFWGEVLVHSLHDQHRRGEIGFWVAPSERRRGVAARAVGLMITWLFTELGLLRIEMTTTPENRVVPALAARLGFTQEGLLRARNVERGQRVDLLYFGLLREEWRGG
jgi:RimJ/RimL family protein N-acetyltransferase